MNWKVFAVTVFWGVSCAAQANPGLDTWPQMEGGKAPDVQERVLEARENGAGPIMGPSLVLLGSGGVVWADRVYTTGAEVGDVAGQLVQTALGLIGVPYRRGGSSPATGLDCSGLVRYVYANTLGLVLPRRAADQAKVTTPIGRDELQPGDLVFFNTMRRAFSHVGVYLGDGKFVHAPSKGDSVKISDMNDRYWARRFNGARRVEAVGR